MTVECCRYGEIVLVGGITQYEGRVDVCLDGRWNTICRDACWGPPDSRVICRQLGFLEIDLSEFRMILEHSLPFLSNFIDPGH